MANVVHTPEKSRFEVEQNGEVAVLTYDKTGNQVVFLHTVVPDELEGQGVGSALAERAVAWAREQDLDVAVECSFVRGWLQRHPEALEKYAS